MEDTNIIIGGGCFWCLEAVFLQFEGVTAVHSGYAGGFVENPAYKSVCSGTTGHAEVIKISFDPSRISMQQLLEIFFVSHDPTTLNRQGNDVGTQYRSVIYFQDQEQEKTAKEIVDGFAAQLWDNPIVTQIEPLQKFYEAEAYHQNYFNSNPGNTYCTYVVAPKVNKARQKFKTLLKKQTH